MNEKVIPAFVIGLIIGVLGSGLAAGKLYGNRSAGEIAELSRRYDQLNREYTERQRVLESNVAECLGYVETARGITERTGENASRAIQNLREASDLIRAGIEERENLKMELNNIRSGLYRIRDLGGLEVEEITGGVYE